MDKCKWWWIMMILIVCLHLNSDTLWFSSIQLLFEESNVIAAFEFMFMMMEQSKMIQPTERIIGSEASKKKKRKNIFVNYKQRSKSIEWIECASEKKCPTKWMNGTNNVDDDSLLDHLLQSLLEQILENPHFQSWWLWWFLVNCFHNQSI